MEPGRVSTTATTRLPAHGYRWRRLSSRTAVACVVAAIVAACGSGTSREPQGESPAGTTTGDTGSVPSEGTSTAAEPREPTVEGTFDVGGHELFLRCEGSGSPAVVYMHGSIIDSEVLPHASGTGFQQLLAEDYQTCVYDRRNVGASDTVYAAQLPADALDDMRNLLTVGGVEPPYVLVGASFGGLLSYLYANEHPDEVVGMVLLDAMFPDELALEPLFPAEDSFQALSEADETESLERISHFKVLTAGQRFIGEEPDIPVTYLASKREGYDDNDYGISAYTSQILTLQAAYVERFSPGRLITVDAPHFMEPVIPDQIAAAVRGVVEAASR